MHQKFVEHLKYERSEKIKNCSKRKCSTKNYNKYPRRQTAERVKG